MGERLIEAAILPLSGHQALIRLLCPLAFIAFGRPCLAAVVAAVVAVETAGASVTMDHPAARGADREVLHKVNSTFFPGNR